MYVGDEQRCTALFFEGRTNVVEGWKTPEVIEAIEELRKILSQGGYNDREKSLRDYISTMKEIYEHKAREEARKKAEEQGREQARKEVALRLLEMGLGIEQITKVTGLAAEAVAKLQAQAVGEPSTTKEEG